MIKAKTPVGLLVIACLFLAGCGTHGSQQPFLGSIQITAASSSVPAGLSVQLTATGAYNDGTTKNLTTSVTWASANTNTATVSASGLVTTHRTGSVAITAILGSGPINSKYVLTVADPLLRSLAVTGSTRLPLGNTTQLRAMGTYSDGSTKAIWSSVAWTSSDESVATVSSSGLVTSVSKGETTITATIGSLSQTLQLTVVDAVLGARFAITANTADSTLSVFIVDSSTGQLRANGYFPLPGTMAGPVNVLIHPSGKFAYVAVSGGVGALAIDPVTGALTEIGFYATAASPAAMSSDPAGTFLYVADGNQIFAFAINQTTGALSGVGGSPFAESDTASALAIDATGHFLYSANRQIDKITAFQIGADGALSPVPNSPFASGVQPAALAVDNAGRFLYVANSGSGTIASYTIDSVTGALVAAGTVAAGTKPVALVAAPSGRIYYLDESGKAIGSVSADPDTGALTANAATAATASAGGFLAFDPTNSFLYSMEPSGASQAEIYSLDQNGDPQWAGIMATRASGAAIAFAPGKQASYVPNALYVLIDGTSDVMFTIDPTGDLSKQQSIDGGR